MTHSTKNTITIISATTAVAVAAGFAAGILLAPKSGRETRKDIKTKACDAKHKVEKTIKHAEHAAEKQIDDILSEVDALRGRLASLTKKR